MLEQITTLKKIRETVNMNRSEFSRFMNIPVRTLEEWEAGRRKMPDYVLRLLAYYIKMEQGIKDGKVIVEADEYGKNK
ncbi:MAG: helix-turn-helix domain-containing protein [Lachnospiraceae bacterium]|nr:helix-turn-helix domain-containing protein [Lachnospiraceae bacterium]